MAGTGGRRGAELDPMDATLDALLPAITTWLPDQRWFAAKDRTIAAVRLVGHQDVTPADAVPAVAHAVIAVSFTDDGPEDRFQLLLGSRPDLPGDLEHAVIGRAGDRVVYDGLADGEISRLLLSLIVSDTTVGSLRFVPEPATEAPIVGPGRPLLSEQSNSSVIYGERAIMKLFRRATPGLNPDLELHRALGRERSGEVAPLLGAIEGELAGDDGPQPMTVAMLQSYAANSADGWSMALTSVRDLLAEGDLRPDEVGGDFAGEAHRLGRTIASVHIELARALGTERLGADGVAAVADWMLERLDRASASAPAVAEQRDAIARVLRGVTAADGLDVQRVHGDLHLGQTLRTPRGWLAIDFEGEPSRPLDDRVRPDSPLRDVAAMLRSFDYAAFHQLAEWETGAEAPAYLQRRAQEWADRNRSAFCDGYAEIAGTDPRDQMAVLRAYELDKAVYEVLYETRNRPNWLAIPLRSMTRLVSAPDGPAGA
ncbi:maltokinase N-terminal cap-like domain-containing protein [Actinomycetospora soli]|uniref:maltokinase N-terminal cap-like domain-containing protein n=1 Tax=Actinomycetospora soli TaxID=2893887 RepID=UPI001E442E54|nr:aminoglycoside phosphotransferase [Actinomycetospora soli]MCD2189282.1 aminoglycoside phosphotransferase [Actinomycetospora soli]